MSADYITEHFKGYFHDDSVAIFDKDSDQFVIWLDPELASELQSIADSWKQDKKLNSPEVAEYKLVIGQEYGNIKFAPGAFDSWLGKRIPVRGFDRAVIGEVEITDVRADDSGVVVVMKSPVHPERLATDAVVHELTTMSFRFIKHKVSPLDAFADTFKCSCGEVFHSDSGYAICPKDTPHDKS